MCFSHQQKCAEKKRDMEKGFRERLADTKNSAIVTNLLLSGTFFESDIFATGSLDSAISMLKTYRNFSQCCGSSTLRSSCSTRNPRGPTTSNAGRSLFLLRKRWSREQRGDDNFSPILQNYIRLFKCTYRYHFLSFRPYTAMGHWTTSTQTLTSSPTTGFWWREAVQVGTSLSANQVRVGSAIVAGHQTSVGCDSLHLLYQVRLLEVIKITIRDVLLTPFGLLGAMAKNS